MTYEHLKGRPQPVDDEETMASIRAILVEDTAQEKPRRGLLGRADPVALNAPVESAPVKAQPAVVAPAPTRANILPDLLAPEEQPRRAPKAPADPSVLWHMITSVPSLLIRFRPSTRLIAVMCMALLVVLRPHWFLISGVLICAVTLMIVLLAGPARLWRLVARWLNRVERRNPARAAAVRARVDRIACRWDAVLDRFPETLVDALYMPDLHSLQMAEALRTGSPHLDRLAHDA